MSNLEKLYEEQHQWSEAYATRQKLARRDADTTHARHQEILAFLENELGLDALKRSDHAEAARRFEAAIELDEHIVPAYLNLGDVRLQKGDIAGAIAAWERVIEKSPERAYLAFARLETAYPQGNGRDRFPALCRQLIDANPQDWRARLALARHLSAHGSPEARWRCCSRRWSTIRTRWPCTRRSGRRCRSLNLPPALVRRYVDLTRDAVFYLDPHICIRCRYRSTELLWQCPQCHEWNTFIEERIAPAKETLKSDV